LSTIKSIFERNRAWSAQINEQFPDFFEQLSKQQSPDYLWIGCSDSRVPANQIMALPPGEVFVHRNIANVVVHTDLNCLSVIQYAVEVLKVKHIIVCGHYGCGGVKAAMGDGQHGLIDNWLRHIKDVERFHMDELEGICGEDKIDRMCELNVVEQVRNVCNTTVVKRAWRNGEELTIHGWIFNISNGVLKSLTDSINSREKQLEVIIK
jgi:carbonic anhydrase